LSVLPLPSPAIRLQLSLSLKPVRIEIADQVEALGTLQANEAVTLTVTVTDTVVAIHFEDGQRVQAGDALVELIQCR
jgi:membrane fusion protein, multidrug efflux system